MKRPSLVLIDTNVVLDLLLARPAFVQDARRISALIEAGTCRGLLCATTLTNVDYLARKQLGATSARAAVAALLDLFDVAAVTRATLLQAVSSAMSDFEDAVQAYSAQQAGAQAIITRDLGGFAKSPVRAYTPAQFLALQAV